MSHLVSLCQSTGCLIGSHFDVPHNRWDCGSIGGNGKHYTVENTSAMMPDMMLNVQNVRSACLSLVYSFELNPMHLLNPLNLLKKIPQKRQLIQGT